MSKIAAWAHERDSQVAFVREIAAWAHERDPQVAFVSETGVPAHERDQQAAFVSKTGALAHERDQQAAFVSKTDVLAHERNHGSVPPDLGCLILFFSSDALWHLRFMSGLTKGHYSLIQLFMSTFYVYCSL